MSAKKPGNMGPISRRGLIRQTAAYSAAVAAAALARTAAGEDQKLEALPGAISWDEGTAAVKQFRDAKQIEYFKIPNHIHGVQLMTSRNLKKVYFEVLYSGDEAPDLGNSFSYSWQGREKPTPVVVHEEAILKPHARLGYPCKHYQLAGTGGSIGWNICFNGTPVCLTAFHVLCGVYWNNTKINPGGDGVLLNGELIGKVQAFTRVDFGGQLNNYELAMASYNDPASDAETMCRSCADASKYPFPSRICSATPIAGWSFHKVGAGSSICGKGKLRGFGDRGVEFDPTRAAMFTNQLIFDKMADAGDSGALVVRDDDTNPEPLTAVGIHYTGSSTVSVSCPIFTQGWVPATTPCNLGPRVLPSFTGQFRQVYG